MRAGTAWQVGAFRGESHQPLLVVTVTRMPARRLDDVQGFPVSGSPCTSSHPCRWILAVSRHGIDLHVQPWGALGTQGQVARSSRTAMPWPTPMHIVATAR